MYQALYRKWRPRVFDDVSGQSHITDTLKRQVETGRCSHAYLFVGSRGTGKTTCAKILAKAVNCEHPVNGNPCNKCASCLGIDSGAILDVEELDAASNNGVENIRALRDDAVFSPAQVKKRVYIVDEVHMLSLSAFNALLKILEEPPEHLMFILATTELHKVPATILSRCQRFSFHRLTGQDIAARLQYVAKQENISLTPGAAALLARLADGAMRDGLSLLDQCIGGDSVVDEKRVMDCIGLIGTEETVSLLHNAADGNIPALLTLFDKLYFGGRDPGSVLDELSTVCRDLLLFRLAGQESQSLRSGRLSDELLGSFGELSSPRLMQWLSLLQQAQSDMSRSHDRRMTAELCLIRMSDDVPAESGDLEKRVTRLEQTVKNGVRVSASAPIGETPQKPAAAEKRPISEEPAPKKESGMPRDEPAPLEKEPVSAENAPISASAPSSGDVWQRILARCRKSGAIDPIRLDVLAGREHMEAQYADHVLTVYTKNDFAKLFLQNTPIVTALKKQAEEELGTPVRVDITPYTETAVKKTDKIDSLSRFSNITFE